MCDCVMCRVNEVASIVEVICDERGENIYTLSSQPLSIIRGKGLSYKKVHTHEGKTVGEGSEGDSGFVASVRP